MILFWNETQVDILSRTWNNQVKEIVENFKIVKQCREEIQKENIHF